MFVQWLWWSMHGPFTRYVKLGVVHAPGMPATFSNPDMPHGTCVTHAPWCMPGSLTSGFLWSRWREKRSRHSRRMRNPQFYVSGKRPMSWDMFEAPAISSLWHVTLGRYLISNPCRSLEDRACVDGIYGRPIFKWVSETCNMTEHMDRDANGCRQHA